MLSNVRNVIPLLEPRPYQTHCLRTFWLMLVPWHNVSSALYVLSAVIVLGVTIAAWRRANPLALRYSALLLATVLVAPHLTVYDLVILAPTLLLLADWLLARPPNAASGRMGTLLYLIYILPLALRYSALLLATVLVAPHLTVYDLVILAPMLLLLADWLLTQPLAPNIRRMRTLLYLVYILPLLGPFTRWTHVQLSVLAMSALMYIIWTVSRVSWSSEREKA